MTTAQYYPIRSFIKFKAAAQLTADLKGQTMMTFIDRPGMSPESQMLTPDEDERYTSLIDNEAALVIDKDLLGEIIQTTLMAECHPELYQAYPTQEQAHQVEGYIITEIVETYKGIKLNQQSPAVTTLNSLI